MSVTARASSAKCSVQCQRLVLAAAVTLLAMLACGSPTRERKARDVTPLAPRVSGVDVRAAIAARLDGTRPSWADARHWPRLQRLYDLSDRAPIWVTNDDSYPRVRQLLDAVEQAPTHALSTAGYSISLLREYVGHRPHRRLSAGQLADADIRITSAAVAYASDMLTGQVDPRSVSQSWYITRRPAESDSTLAATLLGAQLAAGLAALIPADSSYAILKAAYARYRAIADSGGWPRVRGRTNLRTRLAAEGLLARPHNGEAGDSPNDSALANALRRFQTLHGLDSSGMIDAATRRALDVTAADRAHQIGANMERMRWLPRNLGSRYVIVNIPSFRLHAHDSSGKNLEMKVAVGTEYDRRATPAFSDSMEYVVFRPYWNVPARIAAQQLLPRAAMDSGFLERAGYEWYLDGRTRRLRQRPGPMNALGSVKFMFPNRFDIYLHDTPDRGVFVRAERAVSFGCIRLERPDLLAQFVLGWPLDSVRRRMQRAPDNRAVPLPRKLAVYIVYFTAFPRDGTVSFANDIYERDSSLDRALIDSLMRRHP